MMTEHQLASTAELFKILSEASRLKILNCLMEGPLSVGELSTTTGFKQANVSKQLGILAEADIVEGKRTGNMVIYRLKSRLVRQLCRLVCT